jgi:hypothetical protein
MARAWVAVAPTSSRRIILSLILFGIAFGYVEAAVVVYLRQLGEPIRAGAGLPPSTIFPLTTIQQVGPQIRTLRIELGREAATLLMLAAAAWAVATDARRWLAAFSLAFGVWDLAFYGWLRVLIGWPESLRTWDLLFLLPVPWAAPVLAPVIVAGSLTFGGIWALIHTPKRVPVLSRALLIAGTAVLLAAFMWDWRYWLTGGMPRAFPWSLFVVGETLGVAGLVSALL